VANRFAFFTDADVHGPLIKALIDRGWDIIRSVDTFPEGTDDEVLFEYAAQAERVFCYERSAGCGYCSLMVE
jgi:hypothetical protein